MLAQLVESLRGVRQNLGLGEDERLPDRFAFVLVELVINDIHARQQVDGDVEALERLTVVVRAAVLVAAVKVLECDLNLMALLGELELALGNGIVGVERERASCLCQRLAVVAQQTESASRVGQKGRDGEAVVDGRLGCRAPEALESGERVTFGEQLDAVRVEVTGTSSLDESLGAGADLFGQLVVGVEAHRLSAPLQRSLVLGHVEQTHGLIGDIDGARLRRRTSGQVEHGLLEDA